ncbi:MAG: ABC transporter ATP-binding protein, partial [Pseudonocardiaceae bacterium]
SVARELAVLPQAPTAPDILTVYELVEQGRFPHTGGLRRLGQVDHEAIRRALLDTTMTDLARRTISELSGGERQRAWIAMALAQEAPLLLLDEPTTFLDLQHQLELLELVLHLNQTRRTTVVLVLHDLNHACRYASRLVVMRHGTVVADGAPTEVLTPALLREVFRVEATVMTDPATGTLMCVAHRAIPDSALAENYQCE